MSFDRSSGILLHPTSLPGVDGMGDLGPDAYRWIDFLHKTGCGLWQILPLGPTGYGDSPYQCFSAFAGNPLLISSTILLDEGLLTPEDLADRPVFSSGHVDFGPVIQWKYSLLNKAYQHFIDKATPSRLEKLDEFKDQQKGWLENYAQFMTLKDAQGGKPWYEWPVGLRSRRSAAYDQAIIQKRDTIEKYIFYQFVFDEQWQRLKIYAHSKGIKIIGDIPIFISYDSSDAWANPDLFTMDAEGRLTTVAGVPPDYFSPTGQLWGNPLYRWDAHKNTGYAWWIERFKKTLDLVDIIRLDHFRGFAGYWEIPAGMPTAEIGKWQPGPAESFFDSIQEAMGELPIIAEDLGEITPDVVILRDRYRFPGMKIFQFGFSTDADDPFLPHNYPSNCVAYTGTHDNDTAIGWYATAPEKEKDFFRRYLARDDRDIAWDMIRAIWSSVATYALAPLQDFLRLDNAARMNYPGKPSGNWGWRFTPDTLSDDLAYQIQEMNRLYSRNNLEPRI
jgi:4-alpha-glucanotransferase